MPSALLNNSLFLRVISALVLMPLVLAALIIGGIPFMVMVALAIVIAVKEWTGMARKAPRPAMHMALGLFYLAVCFVCFSYIRLYAPHGAGLTLCLMLSVWASDSAAYFAGKAIGGPKMAPAISPNKTWAGLLGGVAGSTAALVLYIVVVGPWIESVTGWDLDVPTPAALWQLALLGVFVTLSGQAGDLLISREKRLVGVKDTGTLIPGHGGLLDRIDSLLLASVVFLIGIKMVGL